MTFSSDPEEIDTTPHGEQQHQIDMMESDGYETDPYDYNDDWIELD